MDWVHEKLRELLGERGVELLTPREHRDRWLALLTQETYRSRLALTTEAHTPQEIEGVLDLAAGVLLELPRLESDAWAGWKDPRLTPVFWFLAMAELPEAPPRAALSECWAELRTRVPFPLARPKAGAQPQPVEDFIEVVTTYLSRLGEEAQAVSERETAPAAQGDQTPPIPPRMLRDRLLAEVERHVERVEHRVLALVRDVYWASFSGQRTMTLLQNARGEGARLGEGRSLRTRSKHRVHLAAWALKQVGLTRLEIGLFLHHCAPTELSTALPGVKSSPPQSGARTATPVWRLALENEVDNSLKYWTKRAGAQGQGPLVEIGKIEFEMKDALRPVRLDHAGYPQTIVEAARDRLDPPP